jgi:signal peptidase I
MNDRSKYQAWVGVLLGFLLNGSAHFLSGKRATGVKWYFSIIVCWYLSLVIMAIPGVAAYVLGILLLVVAMVLWVIMLKQSYRSVPRIGVFGWLAVILIECGLSWMCTASVHTVVQTFTMPPGSMSPTILPGDHFLAEKVTFRIGDPKRGDIVVFKTKGIASLPQDTYYVKRVVGLPGEKIRIDPPNLIVNDQVVSDPPIFHRIASGQPPFAGFQLATGPAAVARHLTKPTDEVVLAKDQYLVLGDNTRNSFDSRYWGSVPRKNIVGRAIRIYWPLNRSDQSLGRE